MLFGGRGDMGKIFPLNRQYRMRGVVQYIRPEILYVKEDKQAWQRWRKLDTIIAVLDLG
jgi:hypothetical protein